MRCCIGTVVLLVLSVTIGSHIYRFKGYVVSLQARPCNEMGFPSVYNNIQFSPYGRVQKGKKEKKRKGTVENVGNLI